MDKRLLAVIALGTAVGANTALAQDGSAIPPPERIDDASISAWLSSHIETDGWVVIAADGVAVALGSPSGVAQRADGYLQADIRHEYYEPTTLGPYQSSSNLQTRLVDCAERRQRVVVMTLFRLNNLQEELASHSNMSAEWSTPLEGSVAYRVIDRVCRAPTEGDLRR